MLSNVYFTAMLLIPFMIQQALSTLCFRRSQFLVLGVCMCASELQREGQPRQRHTHNATFFFVVAAAKIVVAQNPL